MCPSCEPVTTFFTGSLVALARNDHALSTPPAAAAGGGGGRDGSRKLDPR